MVQGLEQTDVKTFCRFGGPALQNAHQHLGILQMQLQVLCFSHTHIPDMQVYSYDDEEQDFESLTLAAERRHLQLSSAATFTTAGQQTARAGYLDTEINPVAPSSPRLGSAGRSRGRVIDTAAAAGVFRIAAGGAGIGGGSVFAPAAAANFRANLMRNGNLRDRVLKDIQVPCLLVSSAKDRMLPSLAEGGPR